MWPAFAVTFTVGFLFGVFVRPTWMETVEFGQTIAGIVTYPTDNPWYFETVSGYTILIQILISP